MSSWEPAKREPDALQAAVAATVRNLLMPEVVRSPGKPNPGGWMDVTLGDGREARIAVKTQLNSTRRFGPRAVVSHDLSGRATLDRDGYTISGSIVIDLKTRSFLLVDCRLASMGRVG